MTSLSITCVMRAAFSCQAIFTLGFSISIASETCERSGVPITVPLPLAWITLSLPESRGAAVALPITAIAIRRMAAVRMAILHIVVIGMQLGRNSVKDCIKCEFFFLQPSRLVQQNYIIPPFP